MQYKVVYKCIIYTLYTHFSISGSIFLERKSVLAFHKFINAFDSLEAI